MKFASYVPNGQVYSPGETSKLSSQLNRDSIAHYHKHIRSAANRATQVTRSVSNTLQKAQGLGQWLPDLGMHPFKIYQLPQKYRASANVPPNPWRTFRVRNGLLLTGTATGITPTGTDMVDQPYDNVFITKKDGTRLSNNWNVAAPNSIDIEVPDNLSTFWFWIELSSDGLTAVIRYGNDPTVSSYSDGVNVTWISTNPWSNYPNLDSAHIPLGFVDTLSGHSKKTAFVRQYWRTDILSGAGGEPCPMG
jgi:hypothetical protein